MNKSKHTNKLMNLYSAAGFSKQAHHAYMIRRNNDESLYDFVESIVSATREIHPMMGLKKIFHLLEPDIIGRDRFINIGVDLGLAVPKPKKYQRTTFSSKTALFKNLAANAIINDINIVWVSDITYFCIKNRFYYITLIMDVYSRRIIGYTASDSLRAEANCSALRMALDQRRNHDLSKLIHHSDRGTQYASTAYLNILKERNIAISMCQSVYENSHIERANGILKNEYLNLRNISSFNDLVHYLEKDVYNYNFLRPHLGIGWMTPVAYEQLLTTIPLNQRTCLTMFEDKYLAEKKSLYQHSIFI